MIDNMNKAHLSQQPGHQAPGANIQRERIKSAGTLGQLATCPGQAINKRQRPIKSERIATALRRGQQEDEKRTVLP